MIPRFSGHNHTDMSNFRLIDSINKLENLVKRGYEVGLAGMAITDHETLAQSVRVCKLQKEYPDFKIAIGNEIYLCDERGKNQKFPHFILIAKDKIGHEQLRKLSSYAWMNSYYDRGMERVPTLKSELQNIVGQDPGHLIATSACIGSELGINILAMLDGRKTGNQQQEAIAYNNIVNYMQFNIDLFGDDFYIEIAPAASKEQIEVNRKLVQIAEAFNRKVVIGDDAHFLSRNDRYVHKSYLNSDKEKNDREVDAFYQYAFLHSQEECIEDLTPSFGEETEKLYKTFCENSMEIFNKIETYSLLHAQTIPSVEVKDYPKPDISIGLENYPILHSMQFSDDIYDRYWINQCLDKLDELNKFNDTYLTELEQEAEVKKTIGEKLGTNIFKYPITLQHYIDMMWDCGSLVGAGRGSSCAGLNHYLLGVTQLDPIKWNLPFFRYLNKDRIELPDIDLDLCPSKRPLIMKKIKAERGQHFNSDIDELSRKNLGATHIVTFGTETAKSAITTACRGYRSEQYPDGIDSDIGTYLASLVPVERGFNWTVTEMVEGNPDKGRQPVALFIQEVNKFPSLLDIILGIEGIIKSRGIHASGVILFDENPYEFGCFMKAPSGEIVTQYDLHDCEAAGMTKYDFLLTSVQDMLLQAIQFLQEDGEIEDDLTIREVYDKYLHPEVLDIKDKATWKNINANKILACFQFDSDIGSQGIKKIQPQDILEMSNTNGLIRLMAPDGEENPMDKYVRFKANPGAWDREMEGYGLTLNEQLAMRKYLNVSYGVGISQEQLMKTLMDPEICGFSLKDANAARKIIGKKQMSKIPELREKIAESAKTSSIGKYVWDAVARPQLGYSFSDIHALAYSFIGYQTAYIATKWNPIYWDTAVLMVNSGSLEVNEIDDDEDIEAKEKNSDYAKIAKALGEIIEHGIKVSLVDINNSDYGFKPDVENNQILFGLKALSGVNAEAIEMIKAGRPYRSIKDFLSRVKLKKTAIISLIKGGAFDNLMEDFEGIEGEPRYVNMIYYLSHTCEPKKKLTLSNLNGLIQKGIIPNELDFEKNLYLYHKQLIKNKAIGASSGLEYYRFTEPMYNIYLKLSETHPEFDYDYLEVVNGAAAIQQKIWKECIYDYNMDKVRSWLKEHHDEALKEYNALLFKEEWDKYVKKTSLSAWEMEALCFYYHDHELKNMDNEKYGIENFFSHSEEPEIETFYRKNIPIYKLYRIAGTVISKNDTRHSISLLTTQGVVPVKFTRDMYAMYKRQLSEVQLDGTKKVTEKGWFTRGTMLIINGFRRDDMFVVKKYARTQGHTLYKITDIKEDGSLVLENERGKQNT